MREIRPFRERAYDASVAAVGSVIFVLIAYGIMDEAVRISANVARWIVGR